MTSPLLADLAAAARSAANRAGPSTVVVGRNGRGRGFVLAPGQVVTNAHNLRDRTTQLTFVDGRAVQATLLAADLDGDIAVVGADTAGAPPLEWAPALPEQGDVVFAVVPTMQGTRVTAGLVSMVGITVRGPRGRRLGGAIEHTAPLARGSSGSPLLDAEGRLVGLNTHRLGEGLTAALPADQALRSQLDTLARGEAPTRLRLGVALAPPAVARRLRRAVGLPDRDGLLVRDVEAGSPAAEAGVREGDLLVAGGGRQLASVDDLFTVLDEQTGASTLELLVVRGIDEHRITVQL